MLKFFRKSAREAASVLHLRSELFKAGIEGEQKGCAEWLFAKAVERGFHPLNVCFRPTTDRTHYADVSYPKTRDSSDVDFLSYAFQDDKSLQARIAGFRAKLGAKNMSPRLDLVFYSSYVSAMGLLRKCCVA